MRYQNWDVLVFPELSKIPIQEFNTACHVVQVSGTEYLPMQSSMAVLPTVNSFIPSMVHGRPFRLSIHSWETPQPSRFTQAMTKHADEVMFEARVFIDGRVAGYRFFGRDGPWPAVIETGVTLDKNGDVEPLKFPEFHQELIAQNFWNAGDDYGRIKVIISEGFPRDSATMPFERVKNLVAFSFQHAPLEVLEYSNIAWPNASMWRLVTFGAGIIPGTNIQRRPSESGIEVHSHSPRRSSSILPRQQGPPPGMGMMFPPGLPVHPRAANFELLTESRPLWRQASSTDVSMPDYSSSVSQASHSRQFTDPLLTDRPEGQYESLQSIGAYEDLCEALMPMRETQKAGAAPEAGDVIVVQRKTAPSQDDHPASRRQSATATPAQGLGPAVSGSVKGRKENILESPSTRESISKNTSPTMATGHSSNVVSTFRHKRQRVVTPASIKAIDQEDEPKDSSVSRKISQTSALQENKDVGRRVLGELPNVV